MKQDEDNYQLHKSKAAPPNNGKMGLRRKGFSSSRFEESGRIEES